MSGPRYARVSALALLCGLTPLRVLASEVDPLPGAAAVLPALELTGGGRALLPGPAASPEPEPEPEPEPLRAGPTALVLQLATAVDASARALSALARGFEAGGEATVVVPTAPSPDCPGEPECVARVLEEAGAERALFVLLVGAGPEVQVAATRVRPGAAPEDLTPVLLDAARLEPELEALAERWARPRQAPRAPGPSPAVWALGGTAAASALAGAVLGGVALGSREALLADGCATRPCDPGRIDALEREAIAADLLFATAATSAALGLVVWVLEGAGR